MSRGKRYDTEPKLNMKKVFAVIIAIAVIIMFIFIIKKLLVKDKDTGTISSSSYFALYKDNKWGVINSNGDIVIDPAYQEMIVIPNSKNAIFICTYDIDYETGEYKTKVLNEKNQEIFTNYDKVEAIANKDENNNLWYEENILKVEKNGKYGIINSTGKELTLIEYDEITASAGIKNSLKVKKDNKYGIINEDGKVVIPTSYADIEEIGKDNKSGFIVKNENNKYGVIDYSNNVILNCDYNKIYKIHSNDLYVVTENTLQKVVRTAENGTSTDVLVKGYDEITDILATKDSGVIFKKANKYGIMDLSGNVILDAQYDYLKEAKTGIFIAKKGDKYGIINNSNEEKLAFNYTSINYNEKADIYVAEDSELNSSILNNNLETKLTGFLLELNTDKGYIKMRIDGQYKYYNLKFEEKYEILIKYYNQNGNINIKQKQIYENYPVGKWLANFREAYKNNKLPEDQVEKLNKLNMLWSDVKKVSSISLFNKKYEILKAYYEEYGNLNISTKQVYKSYPVGDYVKQFRDSYRKQGNYTFLSESQIKQLESIDMVWNPKQEKEIIKEEVPSYFIKKYKNKSSRQVIILYKYLNNIVNEEKLLNELKRIYKTEEVKALYTKAYYLYKNIFDKLKVSEKEYNSIIDYSWKIGVRNAFIQEGETQNESFIPDFTTFRE